MWLFFGFENFLLKQSVQEKAFRSSYLGIHMQVYWQDIPQLLENYALQFDTRREKILFLLHSLAL